VHHHSSIYRESNTNYGCASTLWDRVFGTFEHADTEVLGDMALEPSLGRKLMLPVTGV
jgi:sterol desaturase/sphingolipid hydroxylase (fatty acid hydroxylase superfamily)